jgi:hypothetical protein
MRDEMAGVHPKRALTILCGIALMLCLASVSRAAETVSREALLTAYVDVWSTGELDRLDEIVSSDFQRHAGPYESCRSLSDLGELIAQTQAIWSDLNITIEDQMTAGDNGAFRGEFYGVHAEVGGVIQFPIMSMIRFADGLIAEEWIIGNNFLSLMMLGYELVPPGFEVIPPPVSSDKLPAHDPEDGGQ